MWQLRMQLLQQQRPATKLLLLLPLQQLRPLRTLAAQFLNPGWMQV
jgi:hypothetical protein